MNMVRRSYDESLKRAIVSEIEGGHISLMDASREYGIAKCALRLWLNEYGRFRRKPDRVEVVMKSEKERIEELEKALADSHLKNRLYEEIISLANKKYKTDLKKTFGTLQPEGSTGKGSKSKRSAKQPK